MDKLQNLQNLFYTKKTQKQIPPIEMDLFINESKISKQLSFVVSLKARKTFQTPFNNTFEECIERICNEVYDKYNPDFIYTCENEINIFYLKKENEHIFHGNKNKLCSIFSSFCSVNLTKHFGESILYECRDLKAFYHDTDIINYLHSRKNALFMKNIQRIARYHLKGNTNESLENLLKHLENINVFVFNEYFMRSLYGYIIYKSKSKNRDKCLMDINDLYLDALL